jgi:predicted Zn-dependent peptidase
MTMQQPAIKNINSVHFPQPTHFKLNNGIQVHAFNIGSQEVVQIDVIFETAKSVQDNPISLKVVNEMMGEASKNYAYGEINEKIDFYGAFFESDYNADASSVTLFSLTKHVKNVLPIFADAILHPVFPEREMRIHLSNSKSRFELQHEKVSFLSKRIFNEKLFGNHRYGKLTTSNDFDTLTVDELNAVFAQHYCASNCHIMVSGRFDESLFELLNDHFGAMNMGTKAHFEPFSSQATTGYVYQPKKDALQSALKMGCIVDVPYGKTDYFGLKILNCVLGGYFGSRLMSNIREDKGYTYGINSGINYFKDTCLFQISTELGVEVTDAALTEIKKEIQLLQTEPISEDELAVVKNYLLGSILSASDGPFSIASQYKSMVLHNEDFDFFSRYIHTINTISSSALQELANKHLVLEKMLTVVVG